MPEIRLSEGGLAVCKFRLLSNRYAKGQQITEAVNFHCFNEFAEQFCEIAEKGQLIDATGVQETWTPPDPSKAPVVSYALTWFNCHPRPLARNRDEPLPNQESNRSGNQQNNWQQDRRPEPAYRGDGRTQQGAPSQGRASQFQNDEHFPL